MNKGVWASVAATMVIISAYSLYQLYKKPKRKNRPVPPSTERRYEDDSQAQQKFEDRILYENDVTDPEQYSLIQQKPEHDSSIEQLSYYLILNINKGTNYEGIVKMKVISHGKLGNKQNMQIDFAGNHILYIRVNGNKLQENQFKYERHIVWLKKQFLHQTQNDIQIIFSNRYAFMGNGLTVYFPLDQRTNKYSLKRQIVYSRNGVYQAPRIMPCLNILNECRIQVEMLHSDGFDAYSNAPKSLYRSVSKQEYPCYSFMFQASQKKLNRSFKINTSGYSQNNSSFLSFDDIVKQNSQFYEHKLDSVHDLFLFCGKVTEVRPSLQKIQKCPLLLRYFVRDHLTSKAVSFLNILQCQIVDIYNRIDQYRKQTTQMNSSVSSTDISILHKHINLKQYHKVDIFFVDDINGESDFHKGSLLLNQKTIQRGVIDRRLYYLICRSFVGMGIPKHHVMLTLSGKLDLNELTVSIFPECSDFIFLKQIEYKYIRKNCFELLEYKQQQADQLWIQQFYQKQIKYFVRDQNFDRTNVSTAVCKIIDNLDNYQSHDYWNKFMAAYPFLESTSAQILIKISIKQKQIPKNEQHLNFAKQNFKKSKYYIKFISDEQIQNNLDQYINNYGVQYRLPGIKVKSKFSNLITENNYEKYLKIKSNRLEAHNLYEQFKRFNQQRSFHHYTVIKDEIKRIKTLAQDKIRIQRKNIQCGLMGWKLLSKLRIYPEDEETYKLMKKLLKMKGKEKNEQMI